MPAPRPKLKFVPRAKKHFAGHFDPWWIQVNPSFAASKGEPVANSSVTLEFAR
jgi:hypothetical protein